MRYAVISDVHGNIHALEAVLEDAARQNATDYLFLGDYTIDFPYPNEVVARIRGVPRKRAIQGNKEGYLALLSGQDPSTWTALQHAPLYWTYHTLAPKHLDYLLSLEQALAWRDAAGVHIHLEHTGKAFGALPEALTRDFYVAMARGRPLSACREDWAGKLQAPDNPLHSAYAQLAPGAYFFGHSHVQWHIQAGPVLLLNPGSCGLPMDHRPGAAYALCAWQGGRWQVEERRVAYDMDRALALFAKTGLYACAPFWSELNAIQLRTAQPRVLDFLRYIDSLAPGYGAVGNAYPNAVWNAAIAQWKLRPEKDDPL